MTIELIYDRDCPNVAAARAQLLRAFAALNAPPLWIEWDRNAPESPEYVRHYGSPAILVNGKDVVGAQPNDGSACCRLYTAAEGTVRGVPPAEAISSAIEADPHSIPASSVIDGSSGWKSSLATIPGVMFSFLPNLTCPACWPAYAGLLSSLGLGFLIDTAYLLPLTALFLALALAALAIRAENRRGYGPFAVGLVAAAGVLLGKFLFNSSATAYSGTGLLLAASIWNAWPVRTKKTSACPRCVPVTAPSVPLPEKEIMS